MSNEKNTAVVTVLGRDRVGIIADVSRLLADYGININDMVSRSRSSTPVFSTQCTPSDPIFLRGYL